MLHSLIPFTLECFTSRDFVQVTLAMATIILVLAKVNISILVYLEASAFAHVIHPLTFVNTAYLLTIESWFIWKRLFEVQPKTYTLFVFELTIKLADVNSRFVVLFFQREPSIAALLRSLIVYSFV